MILFFCNGQDFVFINDFNLNAEFTDYQWYVNGNFQSQYDNQTPILEVALNYSASQNEVTLVAIDNQNDCESEYTISNSKW